MTRKRKRWDKHAIKAAVHRRGETLKSLSEKDGLEPSSCKVALHRRNRAGEMAISRFLGVAPSELWPTRYPSTQDSQNRSSAEAQAPASPIVEHV
ncbi:helix-turn-helix domain-containing protein [Methylopila sp. 73B]|uniref:helix-turn-helix domain-containing protein n=1 Tax=Methylopila sp. 73B TaxID=1120792 RepID=UPI000376DDB3|nr:helix-turn-helix domain-containing protein [Methylopila sp. 73B]